MAIKIATGAGIRKEDLLKTQEYLITDYGARSGGSPVENTKAINRAIEAAALAGGGTVVVPEGSFKTYTVLLKSHVNLRLSEKGELRAARTDILHSYEKQKGEGGNYEEPEVNLYAGLQDHGHSYFANSLIYGADLRDIMIYGEGLIDGSYIDEESGFRKYVLQGGDPFDQPMRDQKGHTGEWFGNKAIALVRCENVVLADFSLVIGGHFAIIAEGVKNMRVEHVLVDTTRDAIDIDCCQDVTVVRSHFNSLTDDALVVKASYGAGLFMPSKNILIEDCRVSGYDAGSVYAGRYTRDKLIATDRCGPTGRVKLGTESTCGYEQVTVRRVRFDRSRGFALEAVDGADLKDILFTDCTMDNVSSSPVYIRAGERGRFPVTGNSPEQLLVAGEGNVRLDNRNWVLPNTPQYRRYPAKRYTPSYKKDRRVTVDGHAFFPIVNQEEPARINEANLTRTADGVYPNTVFDEKTGTYLPDTSKALTSKREEALYANGSGSEHPAVVSDIEISNVTITNADPRYPILIIGMTGDRVRNVTLRNISVTYRGGMKMEHAVEQRQLNTNWEYTQFETESSVQVLPWLVNNFFSKEEGLLPRVDWDPEKGSWKADPYNVPEMPGLYPEPSNWGILPAYGIYARHVEQLTLENVTLSTLVEDERHAVVLDDAQQVNIDGLYADAAKGVAKIAAVTNHFRRPFHREYLKEEPYFTTEVTNLKISGPQTTAAQAPNKQEAAQEGKLFAVTEEDVVQITVNAPAPGTPNDSQYGYPTVPIPENGYRFLVPTESYPLPLTVHRPYFAAVKKQQVRRGEVLTAPVVLRDPATQISRRESDSFIYNEQKKDKDFTVSGAKRSCRIYLESKFPGAVYEQESGRLIWDTKDMAAGDYEVVLAADDGLITEYGRLCVEVLPSETE